MTTLESELAPFMKTFYDVISFPEGGAPDWPSMAGLFSKQARITRVTPEGTDFLDLAGFRNLVEEAIEVGLATSFHETEVARRVDRFGKVLHVASAYQTRISAEARDYVQQGVNSLQLIQEDGAWKILSLCWDDTSLIHAANIGGLISGGVS